MIIVEYYNTSSIHICTNPLEHSVWGKVVYGLKSGKDYSKFVFKVLAPYRLCRLSG